MSRAAVLAAALLLVAAAAAADCPLGRYRFEGTIADRATGSPIPGARVHLFLDDDASPWRDAPRRVPDHARTDQEGRFASTALFATDAPAEAAAPARCDARPREVDVFVTREGYFALRQRFGLDALERGGRAQDAPLRLPPLALDAPAPSR